MEALRTSLAVGVAFHTVAEEACRTLVAMVAQHSTNLAVEVDSEFHIVATVRKPPAIPTMAVRVIHTMAFAVHNHIVAQVAVRIADAEPYQAIKVVAVLPFRQVVVELGQLVQVVTYLLPPRDRFSEVHGPFYSLEYFVVTLSICHSTRYRIGCTIPTCFEGCFEQSMLH